MKIEKFCKFRLKERLPLTRMCVESGWSGTTGVFVAVSMCTMKCSPVLSVGVRGVVVVIGLSVVGGVMVWGSSPSTGRSVVVVEPNGGRSVVTVDEWSVDVVFGLSVVDGAWSTVTGCSVTGDTMSFKWSFVMLPTGFSMDSGGKRGFEMASTNPLVSKITPINVWRIRTDRSDAEEPICTCERSRISAIK